MVNGEWQVAACLGGTLGDILREVESQLSVPIFVGLELVLQQSA